MGVSKINYGTKTVMDLSKDTVTASKLLKGITAHDKNGDQITGTYEAGSSGGTEVDKTGNGAYAWAKYSELIDYIESDYDKGVDKPSGYETTSYPVCDITSDGYYKLSKGTGINYYYLPSGATNGKTKKVLFRQYGYRTHYHELTLSDGKEATGKKGTDLLGYISSSSESAYPNAGVQNGVYYLAVSAPDVNVTASKMLENTVACGPDGKVTGTIKSQTAQTITPGTEDRKIVSGRYLSGDQTIKGDANLLAENIKDGVEIFGITGRCKAGGVAQGMVTPSGTDDVIIDTELDKVSTLMVHIVGSYSSLTGVHTMYYDGGNFQTLGVNASQYLANPSTAHGELSVNGGTVTYSGKSGTAATFLANGKQYHWIAIE